MMERNDPRMPEEMPLVSVVIPVYNGERYVAAAIESVLAQTYSNFELIVVDDCSQDASLEVIHQYMYQDHRINVIKNAKNLGVAETRNIGIRASKGKYIALLDCDDLWKREKLTRQVSLLEESKTQISYCSYGFINEGGKEIKAPFIVPETTDFEKMLWKSVISCSTALIDSRLLQQHMFQSDFYHEDYVLWMDLMQSGAVAVGDTEVLAFYRQTQSSRSSNKMHAAVHRWKIFRKELKLPFLKSIVAFVKYACCGVVKYYR